jgi:hypothetical protein
MERARAWEHQPSEDKCFHGLVDSRFVPGVAGKRRPPGANPLVPKDQNTPLRRAGESSLRLRVSARGKRPAHEAQTRSMQQPQRQAQDYRASANLQASRNRSKARAHLLLLPPSRRIDMARSALIAAGRAAAAPPSAISPDTCGGARASALRTTPSAGSVACTLLQLPGGLQGAARAPVAKERSARLVTGAREARNRAPSMLVTLVRAQPRR